jgi:hypothetical protein
MQLDPFVESNLLTHILANKLPRILSVRIHCMFGCMELFAPLWVLSAHACWGSAAFDYLRWEGGITMLVFITAASLYTAMLLIGVQEAGQSTYSDVSDSIMGKGFSSIWVKPFQLLGLFTNSCVMILIGGQAIANSERLAGTNGLPLELVVSIVGLSMILFALFLPDLNHAWMVSG